MCQIWPSSPPGAVSRAMAKPCAGRSLSIARMACSASDNDGPSVMCPSVVARATQPARPGAAAQRAARLRRRPPASWPVTRCLRFGSLNVTSKSHPEGVMSAVVISVVASPPPALPRCGRPACPPVGLLADGTPFYAPIGGVAVDGPLITCHLCGRALRSVTAHLRVHGWTKQAYCEAFGLERGQSLEGQETRKLRAAAFTSRLVFDPAVRAGSAAGRERARAGELTRDAAAAARGRRHPEQRRKKARQAMDPVQAAVVAR